MRNSNAYTAIDKLSIPPFTNHSSFSQEEKIQLIEEHFAEIMQVLGLDLTDDSLKDTPKRVAKMYVNEIFSGLNPLQKPQVSLFENKYAYHNMLLEKNITVFSHCEHHFVPFTGKAHVAYIPDKYVIGLSKINRIVQYYARRPQVQERLTMEIAKEMQQLMRTDHVAVVIEANHLCVAARGIEDTSSSTVTSFFGGRFQEEILQNEFLQAIKS